MFRGSRSTTLIRVCNNYVKVVPGKPNGRVLGRDNFETSRAPVEVETDMDLQTDQPLETGCRLASSEMCVVPGQ